MLSLTTSLAANNVSSTLSPSFLSTKTLTVTQSSSKINASSLFSQNGTGSQLNDVLASYTGDLTACLLNCSNQGVCVLNSLQQYICACSQYRTGKACQSDARSCLSSPCLNNAECSNSKNETHFKCQCSNSTFGIYCENKIDLCQNSSVCFNNQGFCILNDSQPMCKCLMGYSGVNCEVMSTSLVVRKVIIKTSSIVAIIVMVCFVVLVIFLDYTKYFLIADETKKKMTKRKKHKVKRLFYVP